MGQAPGKLVDDRLYIPVREVAAALDLPLDLFIEPPRGLPDPRVIFAANSRYYLVGGQVKVARVAPYAAKDGLWLPLRELAISLGLGVAWDQAAKAPKAFSNAGSLTLKNARIIGGRAVVGPEGWKAVARLAGSRYRWIDNGQVPHYDRSGLLGAGPGIGFD